MCSEEAANSRLSTEKYVYETHFTAMVTINTVLLSGCVLHVSAHELDSVMIGIHNNHNVLGSLKILVILLG